MTNILFLARLFSPHVGGVETHVLKVATELKDKGYRITILTEQFEVDLKEQEDIEGIEVIRVPQSSLQNKFALWKWIWSHRELFTQADVVHVHDVFWWVVPVLPLIKSKYFITFHGWEGSFPIKKTAVLQRKAAAQLSRGVIQVGEYIEKWYGTKPDIVTYGAVEASVKKKSAAQNILKKVINAARKGSFISSGNHKYEGVFVGRLSEDNDIRKVVGFFSLIESKRPKAKFLFVGDGPFAEYCESFGRVTGFVPNVAELMSEARIVCANSYLSILQAQSLGKLVCSFYSNPLKKDYLVEYPEAKNMIIAETAEDGFQKLQEMSENSQLTKAMIKQASDWAKKQSWEKIAEKYVQLWQKAVV